MSILAYGEASGFFCSGDALYVKDYSIEANMILLNSSSAPYCFTAGKTIVHRMSHVFKPFFCNQVFALFFGGAQPIINEEESQNLSAGDSKFGQGSLRNYGLDLLRIVSMYMVCMLHVLGQGGILDAAASNRINSKVAWFFEIAACCAVNCFSLISGYVGCRSSFKPYNLFRLWLQAVFYSFGFALVFLFASPSSISLKELLLSLFPISLGEYWYLTAYVLVFLFTPQMNYLLERQPRNMLQRFIWIFFVLFSALSTMPILSGMASPILNGFSAIWLAYLYMIGGFVRIYGAANLFPDIVLIRSAWDRIPFRSQTKLFFAYLLCIVVTFLLYTEGHSLLMRKMGSDPICCKFFTYNSPTILFAGFSLFVLFSRLNVSRITSFIKLFSPLAFSVYLIQCQKQIWWRLLADAFKGVADLPVWLFPLAIVFVPLAVYVACSALDCVRLTLFKLLRLT